MNTPSIPCVLAAQGALFALPHDHPHHAKVTGLGSALAAWNVAVIELGPNGCISAATPAVTRVLGRQAQELVGQPIDTVVPQAGPLLADAAVNGYAKAAIGLPHPGGGLAAVDLHAVGVSASGDGLVLLAPTERQADEGCGLREAEEWSPVMRVQAALDGRLLHATARFCQWLGYEPQALRRLDLPDLMHPDDRDASTALFAQMRAGTVARFGMDKRYLTRSGEVVWARVDGAVVLDPQGKPRHTLAYVQDITAQKTAEEKARSELARFYSVFDHSPVGLALVDADAGSAEWNRAALEMLGFAPDTPHRLALIGEELLRAYDLHGNPVPMERWPLARALGGEEVLPEEFVIERTDRDFRRRISFSASPLRNDRGEVTHALVIAYDLTARRRSEQTLADERREQATLLEALPVPVITLHTGEQDHIGINPAAAEVLGHETPLRRKDGEHRLIAFNAVRMQDGDAMNAVVVTAEDITERKRTEQALRRSEARFREAFVHAPIGMVIMSLDGRFRHVNPAYCDIVGYAAEELLRPDFNFKRLVHPQDLDHNVEELARLVRGEIPAFFLEKRYVRKDARVVWVRSSVSLQRDDEGRPLHLVALVEDIDERKRGEEDRLILEAMMEYVPMGIMVADAPDMRLRAVSRFSRKLLGLGANDYKGLSAEELRDRWTLYHADGRTRAAFEQWPLTRATRQGEQVVEEEWVLERGDGQQAPLLCSASPIRDTRGQVIAGVLACQDISGRKQMERSLQSMNTELEEFAFVASHDLKAPLRAVENLASWIAEDAAGQLDEENRDRLRLMRERIVRMGKLIEGLLAYARLGRAAAPQREHVALLPLLRELVGDLAVPAGFQVALQEPLPTLYSDPLHLRQIFQNLIGNAIHHHDRPGEGHVWVRAHDGGDTWCLEVADDGPGIQAGERERVFKMFATSDSGGHTGIGLAVVRKIILASGGQIEVTDNAPRGALFRIHWPK